LTDVVDDQLKDDAALAYAAWSRNETREMKPEDDDEKVVRWSRGLTHYAKADENEYRERLSQDADTVRMTTRYDQKLSEVQEEARLSGSKYSAIFNSPHCVQYIQQLVEMPSHFRQSKLLKLSGLSRMIEGNGGVSRQCTIVMTG
jgi:hypothetical protein